MKTRSGDPPLGERDMLEAMRLVCSGLVVILVGCGPIVTVEPEGTTTQATSDTTNGSVPSNETVVTTPNTTSTPPADSGEVGPFPTVGSATSPSTGIDPSSSSGECTVADECIVDADCPGLDPVCIACVCFGAEECLDYGPGAFGNCAEEGVEACGDLETPCLVDDPADPLLGVCAASCASVCDCPAPPAGSENQLRCEQILGDETNCFISCEGGRACPDGWTCFADVVCMVGELPELEPYAACEGAAEVCPDGEAGSGLCLEVPDDMAGTGDGSVCSTSSCDDVTDCPPLPPTGTAVLACVDVTGDAQGNCFLDCSGGLVCPDGMVCHPDFNACYWSGA